MSLDALGRMTDARDFDCPWKKNGTTWIDKRGRKREVPMELLCLGLNRTGTSSLRVALWELGYPSFHGFSVFENPPDAELCVEAMEAKFEKKGRKWTRDDRDALFHDCSAVIDNPPNIFVEELTEAYPKAKIIVTTRDKADWYHSIMATVLGPHGKPNFVSNTLEFLYPTLGSIFKELRMYNCYAYGDDPYRLTREAAYEIWDEHLAKARSLASPGRYLEFDVRDGWQPLCEYLGKPVPVDNQGKPKPFPRVNDAAMFNETLAKTVMVPYLRSSLGRKAGQYWPPILGAAVAIAGAVWAWKR